MFVIFYGFAALKKKSVESLAHDDTGDFFLTTYRKSCVIYRTWLFWQETDGFVQNIKSV